MAQLYFLSLDFNADLDASALSLEADPIDNHSGTLFSSRRFARDVPSDLTLMPSVSKTRLPAKIIVFAHIPPPHHGQSYMVQLMLNGLGGDHRKARRNRPMPTPFGVACYHINARVSQNLEDIGDLRIGKFLLLIGYCVQAIWCHFRFGIDTFYYIPAPGKKSALFRDWLVMFFCRPFFKHVVLHWHAAGLAKWLETVGQIRTRSITFSLMKNVDLSIVLSNYNRADAEKLFPQKTKILSNGIPDPFPQFEQDLWPRRKSRSEARARLMAGERHADDEISQAGSDPQIFKVLYLAHCMTEKGLFDAIDGVLLASKQLHASGSPITMHLTVAGNFVTQNEKAKFDQVLRRPGHSKIIRYVGFVSGSEKERLLRESDLLCFPTFYPNENQPVNLIEAMAFGLPIITTRWRSVAEIFPQDYPGLVDIRSPEMIATGLSHFLAKDYSKMLRDLFVRNFTLERYLAELATAFLDVQKSSSTNLEHGPKHSVSSKPDSAGANAHS